MESLSVERSIWINAPRERVWQAVTDPVQIGQWWPPNQWEIPSLEVGGLIRFGPPDDLSLATIEVIEPPQRFSFRWHPNEAWSLPAMVTTIVLADENDGTRLDISESGYENVPEELRGKRFESSGKGYTQVLEALKVMLEQPTP